MQDQRLVEALFLLCHDEYDGHPLFATGSLGQGLVAAALVDLLLDQRLALIEDTVVVVNPRSHGDLGDPICENIANQRKAHRPRTWIEALADDMVVLTGRYLDRVGLVRHEEVKKLFKTVSRYRAVDPAMAQRPRFLLGHLADHPDEMDLNGAVCLAILLTIGGESAIQVRSATQELRQLSAKLITRTPSDVQAVLAGLTAAVEAQSLTVRR